ncbi:response regulator [Pontiella sulfatireligans]|uniref:Transcriptional regulatory protein DegU n=1 Tax=Pontiella sulfatireligans TaxID=2750658 RepID=A0A6C2UMV5_9BACT|nr:response regulator transcription factor [Pontiella sulfatireligans]VGO20426.1 Transcriptional regulatory protein DegU [Pontiella sulfatireligans]
MTEQPVKIWIVEDHRPLREQVAKMINLSSDLCCEETFSCYDEMLPLLRSKQFPDLMLVDIQLPGINGIEIIKNIRAMYPATQFIVFTISENRTTVFNAICAGASGYLLKDASFDEILRGIRLVIDGGSPLSGPIAAMILDAYKQPAPSSIDSGLTEHELDILNYLAAGVMKKEISSKTSLSVSSVDYYLRSIYKKLQVHSQAGAVAEAFRKGLIS